MDKSENRKISQEVNVVDVLRYFLSKWPWFLLSLAVCCAFAWYKAASDPLVYYTSAKVIIKDPSNKTTSAGLDRYSNSINKVNVANEILQFRSKRLMQEVVSRVNADITYSTHRGLRDVNVYDEVPFKVSFINASPQSAISMTIRPLASDSVELSYLSGKHKAIVKIGKKYTLGNVKFVVLPTGSYSMDWNDAEIEVSKLPLNHVVAYWLSNLGIRQEDEESTILNLAVRSGNPKLGSDILSTLIDVYNEESINDKNRVAVNTADFIAERLHIIESELGGVENDLESYKSRNQIIDIGSTASRYQGESARYYADALQYETQLRIAMFIKDYLSDPARANDLIPSNLGINDMSIDAQISQYNSTKLQRDRLSEDSSESNPVVAEMNNTLSVLRHNILSAIDNIILSINVKRKDAKGYEQTAESRVASIPRKEREMLSIERQQKIKEQLYLFLLNRREENALTQAMADNNARIIDNPQDNSVLISPQKKKIMMLGAGAGLMIPLVLILMVMFLDTRVHSRHDVKGYTTVPYLGDIPLDRDSMKKGKRRTDYADDTVSSSDADSAVGEAFRLLRASIDFITRSNGLKSQTLMMTSFNESAGKSFTTWHLAEVIAASGKSVVMIDADIRKGTLSHRMGLSHKDMGLSEFLADPDVKMSDVLRPHSSGMSIISSGAVPPNPVELLMSKRLDQLVAELREKFDQTRHRGRCLDYEPDCRHHTLCYTRRAFRPTHAPRNPVAIR